jgi:hypothetical protein
VYTGHAPVTSDFPPKNHFCQQDRQASLYGPSERSATYRASNSKDNITGGLSQRSLIIIRFIEPVVVVVERAELLGYSRMCA